MKRCDILLMVYIFKLKHCSLMAKNVSFSVEAHGQPISKSQCMSRSMQIVVGGEGEEPSYSLTFISAARWSLLLVTQKHALTQCALLRYRNA